MSADQGHGGGPTWLFSFIDLAFLMLIAMTQLAEAAGEKKPELGEIQVPKISAESTGALPPAAGELWQLRVYPRSEAEAAPFEVAGSRAQRTGERIELEALRAKLASLAASGAARPLLAPHGDSRSEDLLAAVAALELSFPSQRRAVVEPLLASR
jgi:hypothetical protein